MENVTSVNGLSQVAEIDLVYRSRVKANDRPKIAGAKNAYQLLLQNWDADKIEYVEQFKILLLSRANKVLGIFEVSKGGVAGTVVDPKLVFTAALKTNASAILLAHNHPSGNLIPSNADNDITGKLKEGGKVLDIQVVDHIIVTKEGYYSFMENGAM